METDSEGPDLTSQERFNSLLAQWESERGTATSPIPILKGMAEVIEKETENFLKLDPDPFDDRHPARVYPDCALGELFTALFKDDDFMHTLVNNYIIATRDRELQNAASRLLLDVVPGLETSIIFSETDGLLNKFVDWAENSDEPLRSYATGLLAAAMEVQDIADTHREANMRLVPVMMQRLHDLKQDVSEDTPSTSSPVDIDQSDEVHHFKCFRNKDDNDRENGNNEPVGDSGQKDKTFSVIGDKKIENIIDMETQEDSFCEAKAPSTLVPKSINKLKQSTPLSKVSKKSDSEKSRTKRHGAVSKHSREKSSMGKGKQSSKLKAKTSSKAHSESSSKMDIDPDCSNSSWAELSQFIIGSHSIYPITKSVQQRFILEYLTPLGEYQELLGTMFENGAMELVHHYIDLKKTRDVRLTLTGLRYLASLLCHKKFAVEFVELKGVQKLLEIQRPSLASTGVSICMYYLAYNEDTMERICLQPEKVLRNLIDYALWLLECSHESGRCHATMFFMMSIQFGAVLSLFDRQDGMRKLFNTISTLSLLNHDTNPDDINEDEMFTSRQTIKHTCMALKRYFETHLTLKVDSIKKAWARTQGLTPPDPIPPYKMITRNRICRPPDPLDWVRRGEDPPGTVVKFVSNEIGKGVFALKAFTVGDFLFEYAGVLKTSEEVKGKDQTYIFHFKEDGKSLCIDATESNRLGKYANDDWLRPNAVAKKIKVPGGHPALALFCLRPISSGQEIRYDYGQPECEWRMKKTSELLGKVDGGDSRDDDELSVIPVSEVLSSGHLGDVVETTQGSLEESKFASSSKDKDMVGCDVVLTTKEPSPNENSAIDLNGECENTDMVGCDVVLTAKEPSPNENSAIDLNGECENTEMTLCDVLLASGLVSPEAMSISESGVEECEGTDMVGCDVVLTAKEPSPNENSAIDLNGECENTELSEKDDTSGPDSDSDNDYSPGDDKSGESEDETSSSDARRTNDEHVSDSEDSECIELPLTVGRLDVLSNVVNDTKSPENTTSLDNTESEDSDSSTEPEDEEVYRDVDNKGLYIRRVLTSSTTKTGRKKKRNRVYNARHCCPFCHHLYINFSQHILGKIHEAEPEVQKILSIKVSKDESDEKKKEKERERKKLIAILRNRGDNDHNKKVLKRKRGEVILARRDGENQESFSIKEYGPCPMCLEWLKLSVIARHQENCPANKESPTHQTKGHLLIQSSVIAGKLHAEASEKMLKEVYPIMRNDAIGLLARSDSLIIALGNQWLVRNLGNPLMRKYYVSAVMRLSSRLLMVLRQMVTPSTGTNMEDYLDPTYFTYVARATLKVAQQDNEDEEDLKAPSNALKLSYDIKRMANIKLAQAIQARDQGKKQSAQDFLQLMSIEWSTKLERVLLEERKHTDKKPLPLPNDIVKFNRYLTNEATACDLTDTSYTNFKKIVTLTLAALIAYNRRRPGEVQAIKLSSYFSRKTGVDEVSDELTGKLTEFEKKLLLEQDMMEIRGKCGKFVPVIIPPYIKPLLKYITDSEVRHAAGISSTNNYVFASNRSGVIRGGYSLVLMSDAAGLSKPERIRGTAMRSFMATMSQGMNITPQQQQWIVDHMGHTLNVHNIHYRCTVDVIERIDISKLLLMMDYGQIARFKGKTLDDIKIEELLDHHPQTEHSEEPDPEPAEGAEMEEEYVYVPQDEDSEEIFEADVKKPKRQRKVGSRHKWTPTEIQEPLPVGPERTIENMETMLEHASGQAHWEPVRNFIKLQGVQLLLKAVAIACEWKNYNGRGDTTRAALDVLGVITVTTKGQLQMCEPVRIPNANSVVSMNVVNFIAAGQRFSDPDAQRSALQVIINCVCGPSARHGVCIRRLVNGPSTLQMKFAGKQNSETIEKLWDCVRNDNGIKTLLQLLMVKTPITEADSIRALACQALCGLSRSETVQQILSKLPLFANNQLQGLMKEPVLHEKRNEHLKFCQYASELIERVTGKPMSLSADATVAKLHKANIVAQTKITYSQKELLLLIHQHLLEQGLSDTASVLQREADLPKSVTVVSSGPLTPPQPTLQMKTGITPKMSPQMPLAGHSVNDAEVALSSPSHLSSHHGTHNTQHTPIPERIVFGPDSRASPTSSNKQSVTRKRVIREKSSHSQTFLTNLSTPKQKVPQTGGKPPPTLDSIVSQYLREQHAQCSDPVVACPEFCLTEPHHCPEPKFRRNAPINAASRMLKRSINPRFGGVDGARCTRHFIYSRFRPGQIFREQDEDSCFTCAAFTKHTSIKDTLLLLGSFSGDLKLYNMFTGVEESSYACHDSPVRSVEPSQDGRLVLTSSYWSDPPAALWSLSEDFEKKYTFGEDEYVEFGKLSEDRVIGTKKEVAHIYDAITGKCISTLQDSDMSNHYNRNCATFNSTDELVLNDGVLWDVRCTRPIYKFDQFQNNISGIFHPLGLEIIISSEIWDIRTFHLLQTVPDLDQCKIVFNSNATVMYGVKFEADDVELIDANKCPFGSSFRTFDATDYKPIATIDVKKNIYDLATDPMDMYLAVLEHQGNQEDFSGEGVCHLYEVGRPRKADGEEDEDEPEEDDDDDDDHSDESLDGLLGSDTDEENDNDENNASDGDAGDNQESNSNSADENDDESDDENISGDDDNDDGDISVLSLSLSGSSDDDDMLSESYWL